jgi:hypothetical protein
LFSVSNKTLARGVGELIGVYACPISPARPSTCLCLCSGIHLEAPFPRHRES